jgi:hypothetical protein
MSADFWLNLQLRWDLYHAQEKEAETLAKIKQYRSQYQAENPRKIAMVYRKTRIGEQGSDLDYWLSQPPAARFAALEQIRREYHAWKYGTEPRLQRVLTIVKRQ